MAKNAPVVCAWYPKAGAVLLWNPAEEARGITLLAGKHRRTVALGPLASELVRNGVCALGGGTQLSRGRFFRRRGDIDSDFGAKGSDGSNDTAAFQAALDAAANGYATYTRKGVAPIPAGLIPRLAVGLRIAPETAANACKIRSQNTLGLFTPNALQ